MITRMTSSAPAAPQAMAGPSWPSDLLVILLRWWIAYTAWRVERAAIAQLGSMSDRELKDLGLHRSEITGAVAGEATRDGALRRTC